MIIPDLNVSSFTVQDAGEENYQTGNKKGYCLGHYNTAQNNNTYKVNFTTDGYTTLICFLNLKVMQVCHLLHFGIIIHIQ